MGNGKSNRAPREQTKEREGDLADAFLRGAADAGFETEKIELSEYRFADCLGCMACLKNGGHCVQKDDMAELNEKIADADVIVLACPIYYYTWTSLMKRCLDRMYPMMFSLKNKDFCLITAGGSAGDDEFRYILQDFENFVLCFNRGAEQHNRAAGYILGKGLLQSGDAKKGSSGEAYEMGRAAGSSRKA